MTVGLMQRVCAGYRVPLFDLLASSIPDGLSLYAGDARDDEMIDRSQTPRAAKIHHARNLHLFSGNFYLCVQCDAVSWLKKTDPRALIMEANMRYPMSIAAAGWMRRRNRPVIGWGLGTGSTAGRLSRAFLSRFDALITYSTAGKQSYMNAGFPEENIFIAKNAAVSRPDRPMPPRKPDGFEGRPVVLYVGRLQKRKRLDLLMRACAAQPEAIRPILRIVGDGPVREELEREAASVFPETEFFGALYGDELLAQFDRADLFCLPGTGGLALQQAMASALPLIAAEADGTQADLVRPGNGRVVNPGDFEDLSSAVTAMLSDPVKLRKMGAESFRIVRDEINLEAMRDVFLTALEHVSKGRSR